MLKIVIEAFLLGLIGGIVPGPILAAIFTRVSNAGFTKSLRVVFKALFAETLIALLILTVVYYLKLPEVYFYAVSLLGVLVLFRLAWQVWKVEQVGDEEREMFSLSEILILTFLNGGFWIFWITIAVPRAFAFNSFINGGQFLFLLIFELGWLFSTILLTVVFSYFRSVLQKKKVVSLTFKLFAIVLALFAIEAMFEGAKYFLF